MKKFAKISAMLAAMVLAFAFFGCSDGSSGGSSDDSSEINGGGTSGGTNTSGSGQLSAYTITYKNVENATNDNPASYTSEYSVTLKTPTKDGFVFLGWYTDSEFGNKITEIEKGSTGEITLYAQWWNSTDFVKVPAVSIEEIETLKPKSNVLIKGRNLEIKAFWMSDHEVTQAEWKAVMDGNLPEKMANTDGTADNNPVNDVSWYDALVYCNKRSIKEGLTPCYTIKDSNENDFTNPDDWGVVPTSSDDTWNKAKCNFEANGYRLPTEAEWEYAARGDGDNTTYAGSNNIDEFVWCKESSKEKGTREVKTKKANGYRLYDMSGNVWEWCWDWWTDSISINTPKDGVKSGSYRCLRGGSWSFDADCCTVAYRYYWEPHYRKDFYGFRVVRTAED